MTESCLILLFKSRSVLQVTIFGEMVEICVTNAHVSLDVSSYFQEAKLEPLTFLAQYLRGKKEIIMEGNCLGKMLQDGKDFQEAAGNTITVLG